MLHSPLKHSRSRSLFMLLALLGMLCAPIVEAVHGHDTADASQHCLICQTSADNATAPLLEQQFGASPKLQLAVVRQDNKPYYLPQSRYARGPPFNP